MSIYSQDSSITNIISTNIKQNLCILIKYVISITPILTYIFFIYTLFYSFYLLIKYRTVITIYRIIEQLPIYQPLQIESKVYILIFTIFIIIHLYGFFIIVKLKNIWNNNNIKYLFSLSFLFNGLLLNVGRYATIFSYFRLMQFFGLGHVILSIIFTFYICYYLLNNEINNDKKPINNVYKKSYEILKTIIFPSLLSFDIYFLCYVICQMIIYKYPALWNIKLISFKSLIIFNVIYYYLIKYFKYLLLILFPIIINIGHIYYFSILPKNLYDITNILDNIEIIISLIFLIIFCYILIKHKDLYKWYNNEHKEKPKIE